MEQLQQKPLKPAIVNHLNHNNNTAAAALAAAAPIISINNNETPPDIQGEGPDYHLLSKRSTASRRLLGPGSQFKNEEFSVPPLAQLVSGPPPSRKREEREAMINLRKRVPPRDLRPLPSPRPGTPPLHDDHEDEDNKPAEKAEKRPNLLQRILSHRPMSVVTELSEVVTAWQDSEFITECLCWHNVYRQRHGSPVLSMSPELCEYAQTWANHLAHTNKFYYRNDRDIGQNLYQKPVTSAQSDITGQEASSYWYAAVRQYDYFKEPDVLHANVNAGHFTQVVWAATRFFGVGKARSRDGKIIVVAHYSPAGNISGGFEMNVLPPIPDQYNTGPYLEQDHYQMQQQMQQQRRENNTPSTSSSH